MPVHSEPELWWDLNQICAIDGIYKVLSTKLQLVPKGFVITYCYIVIAVSLLSNCDPLNLINLNVVCL